ncbi:hypothetical protein V1273_003905 [Bradyrhizobium sp. AZCC 1721]
MLQLRNNRGPPATIIRAYQIACPSKNLVPGDRASTDHNLRATAKCRATSLAANRTVQPERHARRQSSIAAIAHTESYIPCHAGRSKGSRHFCAAGTLCASFRHAMMWPATCVPSALVVHMQERTMRYAICRIRFDRRLELRRWPKDRRTNAFRVTILPLHSANPPRTRPATGPFCCFFFDAGEGSCLTSFPRASREAFPKSVVVSSP